MQDTLFSFWAIRPPRLIDAQDLWVVRTDSPYAPAKALPGEEQDDISNGEPAHVAEVDAVRREDRLAEGIGRINELLTAKGDLLEPDVIATTIGARPADVIGTAAYDKFRNLQAYRLRARGVDTVVDTNPVARVRAQRLLLVCGLLERLADADARRVLFEDWVAPRDAGAGEAGPGHSVGDERRPHKAIRSRGLLRRSRDRDVDSRLNGTPAAANGVSSSALAVARWLRSAVVVDPDPKHLGVTEAASATAEAFEPKEDGSTDTRYLRQLVPRLYRHPGRALTSYGLKMHPWNDAAQAAYPWVLDL